MYQHKIQSSESRFRVTTENMNNEVLSNKIKWCIENYNELFIQILFIISLLHDVIISKTFFFWYHYCSHNKYLWLHLHL